jgi:hypothetical protein
MHAAAQPAPTPGYPLYLFNDVHSFKEMMVIGGCFA